MLSILSGIFHVILLVVVYAFRVLLEIIVFGLILTLAAMSFVWLVPTTAGLFAKAYGVDISDLPYLLLGAFAGAYLFGVGVALGLRLIADFMALAHDDDDEE